PVEFEVADRLVQRSADLGNGRSNALAIPIAVAQDEVHVPALKFTDGLGTVDIAAMDEKFSLAAVEFDERRRDRREPAVRIAEYADDHALTISSRIHRCQSCNCPPPRPGV